MSLSPLPSEYSSTTRIINISCVCVYRKGHLRLLIPPYTTYVLLSTVKPFTLHIQRYDQRVCPEQVQRSCSPDTVQNCVSPSSYWTSLVYGRTR